MIDYAALNRFFATHFEPFARRSATSLCQSHEAFSNAAKTFCRVHEAFCKAAKTFCKTHVMFCNVARYYVSFIGYFAILRGLCRIPTKRLVFRANGMYRIRR